MFQFCKKDRQSIKGRERGFRKSSASILGIFIKINLSSLENQSEDITPFSFRTLWRHATKEDETRRINTCGRGARKPKLNGRDKIAIMSALRQTREHDVNVTSKRVQISIELIHVYNCTVRSVLNQVRDGHRYCQARRKGLVIQKDLALRVKFAKRIKK